MRDITFRARRTDNGEWVEGNLVWIKNCNDEPYQCFIISHLAYMEYGEFDDIYQVLPETVGQYTGLTDNNGKKIFEGDILAFSDRLVYVHWHDYCGCWDCSYIKEIDGKPTLHEERSPNKWRYNAEVIGNIHDNKELLEVK